MAFFDTFTYSASDDLQLGGRKYGWENTTRLPAVCLAGFTTNGAEFNRLAQHLSTCEKPRRVLTLDFRGRGSSAHDTNHENYNIFQEAEDVIQGINAAGLSHINIIASSRGGLVAMVIGAMRPGIIHSIILNDVGPQIEGAGLMRIKRYMETTNDHLNWNSAAQFLEEISKSHFVDMEADYWERYAKRIFIKRDGKIIRNYDPKLLNTLSAIDLDSRLPEMWEEFVGISKIPLLVIHGQKSDFLSSKTVEKMQQLHSNMSVIEVEGQGHAPDLSTGKLPSEIEHFLRYNNNK